MPIPESDDCDFAPLVGGGGGGCGGGDGASGGGDSEGTGGGGANGNSGALRSKRPRVIVPGGVSEAMEVEVRGRVSHSPDSGICTGAEWSRIADEDMAEVIMLGRLLDFVVMAFDLC